MVIGSERERETRKEIIVTRDWEGGRGGERKRETRERENIKNNDEEPN